MDYITNSNKGLLLSIKVIPNSSKNEFIKYDNGIRLKITAPPVDNKANKFVIEYLSKTFKIPKTSIKIIKGETSRDKTFLFLSSNDEKIDMIKDFFANL